VYFVAHDVGKIIHIIIYFLIHSLFFVLNVMSPTCRMNVATNVCTTCKVELACLMQYTLYDQTWVLNLASFPVSDQCPEYCEG